MKKSSKIFLALATIWPFLYMILFVGVAVSSIFLQGTEPGYIWAIIIPLHILTMLWIICLTVFYMVNVFPNDRVNKDMKVLWAVVLFMGSIIAMPIYWYLYIWPEPPALASGHAELASERASGFVRSAEWSPRENEYNPQRPPDWR